MKLMGLLEKRKVSSFVQKLRAIWKIGSVNRFGVANKNVWRGRR